LIFNQPLDVAMVSTSITTFLIGCWNSAADVNTYSVSKYDYIVVHTEMKTSCVGLICALTNTTTTSDRQTTSGHDSRTSARGRNRWLWREKLRPKESFFVNWNNVL